MHRTVLLLPSCIQRVGAVVLGVWSSLAWCRTSGQPSVGALKRSEPRSGFTWALLPASPSLLCAPLPSAASDARRSSAPAGGPACPRARLSLFSSGSPASACDGASSSCAACWSAPSPPGPPLQQQRRRVFVGENYHCLVYEVRFSLWYRPMFSW